jgi:hypothetical protein
MSDAYCVRDPLGHIVHEGTLSDCISWKERHGKGAGYDIYPLYPNRII